MGPDTFSVSQAPQGDWTVAGELALSDMAEALLMETHENIILTELKKVIVEKMAA